MCKFQSEDIYLRHMKIIDLDFERLYYIKDHCVYVDDTMFSGNMSSLNNLIFQGMKKSLKRSMSSFLAIVIRI